ncbi:MAG: nuclear transport factor 2 family protein [Pyrinomonadaceae bacterium]
MKHYAICLIVALCTFIIGLTTSSVLNPFHSTSVSNVNAEREVLQVEREYIQANLDRDTDTLDSILADEFTIERGDGRISNKARRLALLENPDFAFEAINTDNVQVEVNGDKATVTGVAVTEIRYKGEESASPPYKFTREYERRDGRWQIVSVRTAR